VSAEQSFRTATHVLSLRAERLRFGAKLGAVAEMDPEIGATQMEREPARREDAQAPGERVRRRVGRLAVRAPLRPSLLALTRGALTDGGGPQPELEHAARRPAVPEVARAGRFGGIGEAVQHDLAIAQLARGRGGGGGHSANLEAAGVPDKRGGEHSDMTSGLSAERAARNESVFRDANERIERRLDELSLRDGRSPFLCECEDPLCAQPVRLTVEEYEAVRAHPRRFLVATAHSGAGTKTIERHDGFDVIEKLGTEGTVAAALDPRQHAT
jgi:hypothetical protein